MSDRPLQGADSRARRRTGELRADRGRRPRCRPAVEGLEGRTLLSYGGSPDLSFGTLGNKLYTYVPNASQFSQAATATQPDGKILIAGNLLYQDPVAKQDTYVNAVARYNADGTIDTTFGTGGYFTSLALSEQFTTVIPDQDGLKGIAIQADGKVLLATDLGGVAKVARLDADGTLDATFGTGGVVTLGNIGTGTAQSTVLDFAKSVVVLPGGAIGVGGAVLVDGSYAPAVEELNADGSVASGYGTAGLATIAAPSGFTWSTDTRTPDATTGAMLAQADGKILLVGLVDVNLSTGDTVEATVINRLDVDGTLDTSFGTGGQDLLPVPFATALVKYVDASVIALQSDGKLVVAGDSPAGGLLAGRLNADGTVDTTYGIGGYDILPTSYQLEGASAIAIQADGKAVIGSNDPHTLVRLDADGLPDPSFGEGGRAIVPLAFNQPAAGVNGLSISLDGAITVIGPGYFTRLLGQGAEGDYDDNGVSDPAVLITSPTPFNPLPTFTFQSNGGGKGPSTAIGDPGAPFTLPAPGAYDGGGITEVAVYRPGSGTFDVKPYNGGPDVITAFGTPGLGNALPAPGDYDHSGKTELAVYSPAQGAYLLPAGGRRPGRGVRHRPVRPGAVDPGPGRLLQHRRHRLRRLPRLRGGVRGRQPGHRGRLQYPLRDAGGRPGHPGPGRLRRLGPHRAGGVRARLGRPDLPPPLRGSGRDRALRHAGHRQDDPGAGRLRRLGPHRGGGL